MKYFDAISWSGGLWPISNPIGGGDPDNHLIWNFLKALLSISAAASFLFFFFYLQGESLQRLPTVKPVVKSLLHKIFYFVLT